MSEEDESAEHGACHLAGDKNRALLNFALFEQNEQTIEEVKHANQGYFFFSRQSNAFLMKDMDMECSFQEKLL